MAKKKAAKKSGSRVAVKKKSAKKSPARSPRHSTNGEVPKIRVRMFRQGLGDCFLITFNVGGDERHMLIDCGTLGNKASDVKIADVAKHIEEIIGEGKLDVVVATHEHQDHLSGFNGPMRKLENKVAHVWLAWTEDPRDPAAQAFAKNKRDLGAALAHIAAAAPQTAVGQQVNDLLGFAGDMTLGAAHFAETVNEAMEFVRTGLGATTAYYKPGDLIEEAFLPGFRIYVLGPPRDEQAMKDLGAHGSSELYSLAAGLRSAAALLGMADGAAPTVPLSSDATVEQEFQLPFDQRYIQRSEELERDRYPGFFDATQEWRRIDEDWLNLASHLALQLDSMTNNSSLALAIERIADGCVLLFPADAQQGNWLSWHAPDLKWRVRGADGKTREVTAADLLARTVFYKVGHHASHNATARGKGLELMEREDALVAFIPVDRAVALSRNPKDSWQMPARPLYRRLLEKCNGRVARSDMGWAAAATEPVEKEFTGMASSAQWQRWSAAQRAAEHVRVEDLFVEYLLD